MTGTSSDLDDVPFVGFALRAREWAKTRVVRNPLGWALPLALGPVCFVALGAILAAIDDLAPVALILMAPVAGLFEAFYAGLWAGELPWMKGRGVIWRALLWTFALWVLALGLLAPLTRSLYEAGVIDVTSGIADRHSETSAVAVTWDFAVLFIWHGLDAIPALEITKLVRWNEPVNYEGFGMGLLLVAYRAAVLIPLVASMRGVWKVRGQARET